MYIFLISLFEQNVMWILGIDYKQMNDTAFATLEFEYEEKDCVLQLFKDILSDLNRFVGKRFLTCVKM